MLHRMKILPQHPLALLGLGLALGGGITHVAWLMRDSGKPGETEAKTVAVSSRTPSSKRPRDKDSSNAERLGEKARAQVAKDPRKAWEQGMAMENLKERSAFLGSLMREWGRQDSAAALEMAGTLPPGQLKQEAYDAACAGWASMHPEAAAKWAVAHLSGAAAGTAFGSIAGEWAAKNPPAAAAWVSGLTK